MKQLFKAALLSLSIALFSVTSNAAIIDFEGLVGTSDSFDNLGINNTYFGHSWSASGSNQSPTQWGAAESSVGDVSAFAGTGFAWTFNGGQSMFVDFANAQNVNGVFVAGQFTNYSASAVQLFGYDALNNLLGQSALLNIAVGQWQFLSGGALAGLAVDRLEIRSNAPTTWFALDNLDVSVASEVSEPANIVLISMALVGFAFRRRKASL